MPWVISLVHQPPSRQRSKLIQLSRSLHSRSPPEQLTIHPETSLTSQDWLSAASKHQLSAISLSSKPQALASMMTQHASSSPHQ